MSDDQSKNERDVVVTEPLPIDDPRRLSCAGVNQVQNALLSRKCANKVNKMSCRCSACKSDETNPVITSPVDAPLLNTGYDGSGGALSSGADLNWEIGMGDGSGPASVPSWSPAQVVSSPSTAWVQSPFSNASWISNSINEGNDAYFRYAFNLSPSVNPATFAVIMDFYADNRVWEIYVNGVAQSTQPNGSAILPQFQGVPANVETRGFEKGNEVHIELNNNWRQCDNEIIVHVKSPGGVMGFLAQNAVRVEQNESGCDCPCDCLPVEFPKIEPCISVTWGDTPCDCLETDDVEVVCITVCNCHSNVTFANFTIGQIFVTDMAGNPVPALPDGTPSVQAIPSGPICFGDIGPCSDKDHPTCVSRELVIYTRGAVGKRYRLTFNAICFSVCHQYQSQQCFTFKLCQD